MNPTDSDFHGPDLQHLGCHPRSWGEGTRGPGLLCLHGLGDWGRSFERLASFPGFAGYRIFAPDLPGYGESARPAPDLSLPQLAEGLAAALGAAGGGPISLLGHSMGGTLAQLIAERVPDLVGAVVNVEGNTCLNDCAVSGPVAARSLRSFLDSGFSEILSRLDEAGREDPETARYASALRLADPVAVHRHSGDLVALSKPADLPRRFAALAVPTLYIGGSPRGIGPQSLGLLREAGVNLRLLSPAGHCPHRDDPEGFARCVAEFLDRAGMGPAH